jgi:hypothetical protein
MPKLQKWKQRQQLPKLNASKLAEGDAIAKQAILDRLGLTAEEAALLLK